MGGVIGGFGGAVVWVGAAGLTKSTMGAVGLLAAACVLLVIRLPQLAQ